MQLLHLFPTLWMVIAVGGLEFEDLDTVPSEAAFQDSTLFNNDNIFEKPAEPPSNFVLDNNDQWSFETESLPDFSSDDSAWPADILLADNDDPNQTVDLNSDFLFTGSGDCVIGGADDRQFFTKARRGESCQNPPTGQAGNSNPPNEDANSPSNNPIELNPYSSILARDLQPDNEICPIMIFGLSNIPVCKGLDEREDFQPVGPNSVNIRDVLPRTCLHALFSFS